MRQVKPSDSRSDKVLGQKKDPKETNATDNAKADKKTDSLKLREDADRNALRKREHKALMKSLTQAQVATASMGKFDRK